MTPRTAGVRKRSGKWLVHRSGHLIPRCFATHSDALRYAVQWVHGADQTQSSYTLCR